MVIVSAQTLREMLNDIPNFPVYLALITPGLCAWFVVWAKEKKERSHPPADG